VSRDDGCDANGWAASAGAANTVRGAKRNWLEDTSFYDWDTAAIDAWIDANGGRSMVENVEFFIRPVTCPGNDSGIGVNVFALRSGSDWVEGDGTSIWVQYNWTQGTPAATYANAQHYWQWNDNGTPTNTTDDYAETDLTNTIPWQLTNSAPVGSIGGLARNLQNSVDWVAAQTQANTYVGVVLDKDLWEDLLDNPQNRGIILWALLDPPHPDENWTVYMKEAGPGYEPYLEVTMRVSSGTIIVIKK
jgi:hypothetical protein